MIAKSCFIPTSDDYIHEHIQLCVHGFDLFPFSLNLFLFVELSDRYAGSALVLHSYVMCIIGELVGTAQWSHVRASKS
jgi:hypothetical protein